MLMQLRIPAMANNQDRTACSMCLIIDTQSWLCHTRFRKDHVPIFNLHFIFDLCLMNPVFTVSRSKEYASYCPERLAAPEDIIKPDFHFHLLTNHPSGSIPAMFSRVRKPPQFHYPEKKRRTSSLSDDAFSFPSGFDALRAATGQVVPIRRAE